jgi:hypothetical protein
MPAYLNSLRVLRVVNIREFKSILNIEFEMKNLCCLSCCCQVLKE